MNRADGDAGRFDLRESAFRVAPGPTETRLYLETIEQALAGKSKLILDSTKARRQLYWIDGGIEIGGSPLNPVFPKHRQASGGTLNDARQKYLAGR